MTKEVSIFDLGVEEVPLKTKSKKDEKTKNKKTKNEKTKKVKVSGDWTIHFGSDSFSVSDFIDEIPEEGVSLEILREEMERHFSQFTAQRTKWDIDEENHRLFPYCYSGSKGTCL